MRGAPSLQIGQSCLIHHKSCVGLGPRVGAYTIRWLYSLMDWFQPLSLGEPLNVCLPHAPERV